MKEPDNSWVYVFFGAIVVLVLVVSNIMGCNDVRQKYLNYDQPPEGSQYP